MFFLKRLEQDSSTYYFWLFVVLHTLFWTLGPSLARYSIPHDTLEGITWGLQWQLGYYKHPFLTAWLCAGVTQLLGIGWPVYLLAQIAVSLTFVAVWQLGKQFFSHQLALISVLILEGVVFYNINSFNFTPDTLQTPLWAWLSLFFYYALTDQRLRYWLSTGVLAAICVCTKYQVIVLLLPMLGLCLYNKEARKSFKNAGFYWGILLFSLLLLPHVFWLYKNHFITLKYAESVSADYTLHKTSLNHLTNPLRLLISYILDVFALFLLIWPFYRGSKATFSHHSLQKHFLLFIGLGPLVVSIILCFFSGDYFPPRWSTPYFSITGLLVVFYLKPLVTPGRLKQFAYTFLWFSGLLFVTRMSTFTLFPRAASDAFLPNKKIALHLSKFWHEKYHRPLPYLAGSSYLISTVIPYMPDKPIPYFNWIQKESPWIKKENMTKNGAIFIWDKGKNYTWDHNSKTHTQIPKHILKRYPNLIILPSQKYSRLSDNYPIEIGMAILPPAESA